MTLTQFTHTLTDAQAPDGLSPALSALWLDGHGDWEASHAAVQGADDPDSAWVHAYLHRKEGDIANAGYWYRRAGRPVFTSSLDREWQSIAAELLEATGTS